MLGRLGMFARRWGGEGLFYSCSRPLKKGFALDAGVDDMRRARLLFMKASSVNTASSAQTATGTDC